MDGRGRVSYTVRYLGAHKFQKTELIVARSLLCWAVQSMVDSIKGLASSVSSTSDDVPVRDCRFDVRNLVYSTVSKFCRDLAVYTV